MDDEIAPGIHREVTEEMLLSRMDLNWHRLLRGAWLAVVFIVIDGQLDFWIWHMLGGAFMGSALGAWFNLLLVSRQRSRLRDL